MASVDAGLPSRMANAVTIPMTASDFPWRESVILEFDLTRGARQGLEPGMLPLPGGSVVDRRAHVARVLSLGLDDSVADPA